MGTRKEEPFQSNNYRVLCHYLILAVQGMAAVVVLSSHQTRVVLPSLQISRREPRVERLRRCEVYLSRRAMFYCSHHWPAVVATLCARMGIAGVVTRALVKGATIVNWIIKQQNLPEIFEIML